VPALIDYDGFDGHTDWPTGPTSWQLLAPVSRWNDVLSPLGQYKGNSQQGMASQNGNLFIATRQRVTSKNEDGPRWNGLARASGTALPARAFAGVSGELFSTTTPQQSAGPDGIAIATTSPGDSFAFASNYDGTAASGLLHVQLTTDP